MMLNFNLEEANVILSALSDMDDFYLPKSISRKDLYTLARKFAVTIGLRPTDDGKLPLPNLFRDRFDVSTTVMVDITQTEIDYIICALAAMNFEKTGHPKNIISATSKAYNKLSALYSDGLFDESDPEIWEIVVTNQSAVGQGSASCSDCCSTCNKK